MTNINMDEDSVIWIYPQNTRLTVKSLFTLDSGYVGIKIPGQSPKDIKWLEICRLYSYKIDAKYPPTVI